MFDCADDKALAAVKSEVAAMETSLRKLTQQEEKYSAELDSALAEFSELRSQAATLDADELQAARQDIRPAKELETVRRLQDTYGERYDYRLMDQGQCDAAELLGELVEFKSVREQLSQAEQAHKSQAQKKRQDSLER